jgi:FixJ family two-component response regulator
LAAADSASTVTKLPTLRVLLVDNDPSLRRALARTVQRAGFEVECFASIAALVASGAAKRGACLVLDIDLPGVGGIDLDQALTGCRQQLPTVFITASGSEGRSHMLASMAPVAVLDKPFDGQALLAVLSRIQQSEEGLHE